MARGTGEDRFLALAAELTKSEGVEPPDFSGTRRRFGSNAIKVEGKIFALFARDRLVVKLPQERVDSLVASRQGTRFDPRGNGQVMKEWVVLDSDSPTGWRALATEALAFVRGSRSRARTKSR
jgi:hypothetical protein